LFLLLFFLSINSSYFNLRLNLYFFLGFVFLLWLILLISSFLFDESISFL
jgi:hypothetical protein